MISGPDDVEIPTTLINIPEVEPQEDIQAVLVEMIFSPDRIAQEGNETFTLRFDFQDSTHAEVIFLRNNLSGIVVDMNGESDHPYNSK